MSTRASRRSTRAWSRASKNRVKQKKSNQRKSMCRRSKPQNLMRSLPKIRLTITVRKIPYRQVHPLFHQTHQSLLNLLLILLYPYNKSLTNLPSKVSNLFKMLMKKRIRKLIIKNLPLMPKKTTIKTNYKCSKKQIMAWKYRRQNKLKRERTDCRPTLQNKLRSSGQFTILNILGTSIRSRRRTL